MPRWSPVYFLFFFPVFRNTSSPIWPNRGFRCRLYLTLRITLINYKLKKLSFKKKLKLLFTIVRKEKYIFLNNNNRKFFNSHLFWLNSHPGRACLVLRACRSAAFLDHDTKKGCEFNQKMCEFKIFLIIIKKFIYIYIYIYIYITKNHDLWELTCENLLWKSMV